MPEPLMTLPLLAVEAFVNTLVVIAGIGFLIFVHELGHFLVAKWGGVRVEKFSLGFGPALLRFRRGETEYRLSLIMLGGYVKMAGETPADEHTSDSRELQNKPVPVRAAIFAAGVTMNAVFGVLLFVLAFNIGVPLPSPVVATVRPGSPAWKAGIQPGDRILSVGGGEILDFQDVFDEVAFARGPLEVVVERNGRVVTFPDVEPERNAALGLQMLGVFQRIELVVEEGSAAWRAGFRPRDELVRVGGVLAGDLTELDRVLQAEEGPVDVEVRRDGALHTFTFTPERATGEARNRLIGVTEFAGPVGLVRPGSPAEAAGLRPGDEIAAVDGIPARDFYDARKRAMAAAPAPVTFTVRRGAESVTVGPVTGIGDTRGWDSFFRDLAPAAGGTRVALLPDIQFDGGNPARGAGLAHGDRILEVNGAPVADFAAIHRAIAATPEEEPVHIVFEHAGERRGPISVERRSHSPFAIGDRTVAPVTEVQRVPGVFAACAEGFRRSLVAGKRILQFLGGIFSGRVSAQNIGGPVLIFQISYATARKNFIHFLYFLGLLSINLAIINLLPIPILDGGLLLFLLYEAIRGRPMPQKAMAVFQWAGLFIILLLMVFVIANDVTRILR